METKYLNVPIELLSGFLRDKVETINNILYYGCYEYSIKNDITIGGAASYFGLTLGNEAFAKKQGVTLLNSINTTVMVGINVSKLFEFLKEDKTDFDKACFLAFLALKSILMKKPYCKITNTFLLSRMNGDAKSLEDHGYLSEEVFKYANDYQIVKIKRALSDSWGLVTYSRYTRGFYVSFALSLEDLVYEAEKRKKSTKDKQRKEAERVALKKALERLTG